MDTASTVTANQSVAAAACSPATGAWLDSAAFHDLLDDFRTARQPIEIAESLIAIKRYVRSQYAMGSEQFTPEHYARYQAAQNELGPGV